MELRLFGPPRIEAAGRPINLPRKKAMALMAYLSVTERPFRRDSLAALLWPDDTESRARASLRMVLSQIRKSLGPEVLATAGETVEVCQASGLSADVAEFDRLLATGRAAAYSDGEEEKYRTLSSAVDLYSENFMAGFTLGDCLEFSDWQFQQGEYYKQSLAGALTWLSETALSRDDYSGGVAFAQRLVSLDNLDEAAHRILMRSYALDGKRSVALRQYELCQAQLRDELGLEPEEETRCLYEEVKRKRIAPSRREAISYGGLRLAVLPFANLSGEDRDVWFADSMTDAMIGELSKASSLQVISYTSSSRYRDTRKSLHQIATELGVTHILEGAVLRAGAEVRVSAQLIDAATDKHIWADTQQRQFEEILALQSQLARSIAAGVHESLRLPAEGQNVRSVAPKANEAVLFARYLIRKGGVESENRAIPFLEDALEIVPDYVPALETLLAVFLHQWTYGDNPEKTPREVSRRKICEWVDRIRATDPGNSTARIALYTGAFREAIAWAEKARDLDPVSPGSNQGLVAALIYGGYHRRARQLLERMLVLYPDLERVYGSLAYVYGRTGEVDKAIYYASLVLERLDVPMVLGYAGRTFAEVKSPELTERVLGKLQRLQSDGRTVPHIHFAQIHDALGQTEEALVRLESSYQEREGFILGLAHLPEWEQLRSETRCQDLIRRIGIS